jgi:hypothetical protein
MPSPVKSILSKRPDLSIFLPALQTSKPSLLRAKTPPGFGHFPNDDAVHTYSRYRDVIGNELPPSSAHGIIRHSNRTTRLRIRPSPLSNETLSRMSETLVSA